MPNRKAKIDDRHLDVDRLRRLDAPDRLRAEAVLEDEHDQAPGGGDGEQVQQDGLQRQDQRAEGARQQDERQHARSARSSAGSCRRRRRGSRRSAPPRRRPSRRRAARVARMRSSVARPAAELPSAVGMTVTSAVPSRRQSAGAAALRTPSTSGERRRDGAGVARADERVERRQRAGADAGVLQLLEAGAGGPALGERVGARVAELDRRGGDDERGQHGGRRRRRRPSGGGRRGAPRPTSRGWRGPRGGCAASRASGRPSPGRPAAA